MPPKKPAPRSDELFRSQLDNMVDLEAELGITMGHKGALEVVARMLDSIEPV